MEPVNLALWGLGIVLVIVGVTRARAPWARYQALKAQAENDARYDAWRGGVRGPTGPTGASVAMDLARRQARMAGAVAVAGVVCIFLGFLIR